MLRAPPQTTTLSLSRVPTAAYARVVGNGIGEKQLVGTLAVSVVTGCISTVLSVLPDMDTRYISGKVGLRPNKR